MQRIQEIFTGRLERLENQVDSGERSENLITGIQHYVYGILSGRKGRRKQEAEMWMAKSGLRFDTHSKDVIYSIFELFEGEERDRELEKRSARIRKDNESWDWEMNTFSKPANSYYSSSSVNQKKRGNVDTKSQTQSHEQKNQSHDSVDPKNKNTTQSTARKNHQTQSRNSNTVNSTRAANSFRTASQPFVMPSFTETVQGIAAQEAKSPETLEMEFQKRVQNTKDTYEGMRQDAREVWKDYPEVLEMTLNSIDRREKRDLEHEEQMYRKKIQNNASLLEAEEQIRRMGMR